MTKKLKLTDEEVYALGCILGHVRHTPAIRDLLNKVDKLQDKDLLSDDYDRVSVQVDIQKGLADIVIEFN